MFSETVRGAYAASMAVSTAAVYLYTTAINVRTNNTDLSIENEKQLKINAELPCLKTAQKFKVHRSPKLFSDGDIDDVLRFQKTHKSVLGTSRRDGNGFKTPDGPWSTYYLNTDGLFQRSHSKLVDRLIETALSADSEEEWGLLNGDKSDIRVRVVELHKVEENGSLANDQHFDQGSLVTVDVMCSDRTEYEGGEFTTLESDGALQSYEFNKGDVLVFPSHKYHCVQPVTGGTRKVLVMELWRGETRECAHRCLKHLGPCHYSIVQNKADNILTCAMPTIDPW